MKKNTLVKVVIVGLFLIGLFLMGLPSKNQTPASPIVSGNLASTVLAAEVSQYDFGTISMMNGNVSYDFMLKNMMTEPVRVTKMYTSCMCTTAMMKIGDREVGPFGMSGHGGPAPAINEIIEPGQSVKVSAIFDPAAHGPAGVGRIERSIYLESDKGAPVELKFSANVTP